MANFSEMPACWLCKKEPAVVNNELIGGWYCKRCDEYITKPEPRLEAAYNQRRSKA